MLTGWDMFEGNARLVKAWYWFVNDELEPLTLNLGDAKFLCFFSTRWNAKPFKQGQAMPPGRWTMLSTEPADHLNEVCERANSEGYTDFALNPPPDYMAGTGGGPSMSSKGLTLALPVYQKMIAGLSFVKSGTDCKHHTLIPQIEFDAYSVAKGVRLHLSSPSPGQATLP
jgi:hypothetical protein